MSTLKVNAIQNTSGVEQYLCKAWVNFNGTGTVAIRESGNVSSLTDNGTGNYSINFSTAMPDANYSIIAAKDNTSDRAASEIRIQFNVQTTTSGRVICIKDSSPFVYDENNINVAVFR